MPAMRLNNCSTCEQRVQRSLLPPCCSSLWLVVVDVTLCFTNIATEITISNRSTIYFYEPSIPWRAVNVITSLGKCHKSADHSTTSISPVNTYSLVITSYTCHGHPMSASHPSPQPGFAQVPLVW